ncbi:tetratricopeptide repeat protein [Bradyrhizobium sp. USDA 4452]
MWGLSAIRARATAEYDEIVGKLRNFNTRAANRIAFFLEGFHSRLRNDWDGAEQKFLECWKLSKDNQSTNRELASLYCKQRRYSEAEAYARSAYKIAPTNPFIIDIMTETLLGKAQLGLAVDPDELSRLMAALKTYGDAPGSSFFLVRLAQAFARERKYSDALKAIGRAIDRTSNLLPPYFIRADVLLAMNDPNGAEKDLAKIEQLLEQAGGFSEGDEAQVHDLAVRIMIEKRQFRAAKNKIDTSAFLPKKVRRRLLSRLARAIGFSPESADRELQRWAASFT